MSHLGFDDRVHEGQIVVNRDVAAPLAKVFRKLYDLRFPIRHMRFADAYGPARPPGRRRHQRVVRVPARPLAVHGWDGQRLVVEPRVRPRDRPQSCREPIRRLRPHPRSGERGATSTAPIAGDGDAEVFVRFARSAGAGAATGRSDEGLHALLDYGPPTRQLRPGCTVLGSAPTIGVRTASGAVRVWTVRYRAHNGLARLVHAALPDDVGLSNNPPYRSSFLHTGRPHGAGEPAFRGDLRRRGRFAVISPDGHGRFLPLHSGAGGQIHDLANMQYVAKATPPWLRVKPHAVFGLGGSMGGQETLLLVARHGGC